MSEIKITKNDVKAFIDAAHGDFDKLKQLLAEKPSLLNMPNGNETAMGAACQMKRTDIIAFLLEKGAPMDIYVACTLGLTDKVAEFLDADPSLVNKKNKQSHVKPPTFFASQHPEVLELLKSRGAK